MRQLLKFFQNRFEMCIRYRATKKQSTSESIHIDKEYIDVSKVAKGTLILRLPNQKPIKLWKTDQEITPPILHDCRLQKKQVWSLLEARKSSNVQNQSVEWMVMGRDANAAKKRTHILEDMQVLGISVSAAVPNFGAYPLQSSDCCTETEISSLDFDILESLETFEVFEV